MNFHNHHLWLYLILPSLIFLAINTYFGLFLISLIDQESSSEYCQLCNYTPVIEPKSTIRDLIMTATTEYNINLLRLIRSIRTSGCIAKIIIFTTNNVKFPKSLLSCGVEQIVMSPPTLRVLQSPHKTRWEWYFDYLKNHPNKYDRVMHVDAFDTFFFGDPFAFASDYNTLYFQQEGQIIKNCPYNKNWLFSCHKDAEKTKIANNMILCSGSLIGGFIPFFEFVKILVTHDKWSLCWKAGFDQGDFNYIFYTKWKRRRNSSSLISTKLLTCEDRFMTMFYCIKQPIIWNTKNQISYPESNNTIIFMHQYNRFNDLLMFVKKISIYLLIIFFIYNILFIMISYNRKVIFNFMLVLNDLIERTIGMLFIYEFC